MIKQAIITKYLPATNYKGSRIKATASAGSVTIPYPHAASSNDCHKLAAVALAKRLGWYGEWIAGSLDKGEVFVQTEDNYDDINEEVIHSDGFSLPRPFTIPADEIVLFAMNTGELHRTFMAHAKEGKVLFLWEHIVKVDVLRLYRKDAHVPHAHFTPTAIRAAATEIQARHLEMIEEAKQPTRAEVRAVPYTVRDRIGFRAEYQNKDGTWTEVLDAHGQRVFYPTMNAAFAAARSIVG